jgi:hypothetical protein
MKKLLILMLVLSVTAIASAAMSPIEFSAENVGDNSWDISITAPGLDVTSLSIAQLSGDSGTLQPGSVSDDFDISKVNGALDAGSITGVSGAANGPLVDPPAFVTDALYTFNWTGSADTVDITLGTVNPWDSTPNIKYYDGSQIVQEDIAGTYAVSVPEPLTIGLLGLGGLFIRRRKA